MDRHIDKYLGHLINYHEFNFASEILGEYILRYSEDFINHKNSGENLCEVFGRLAFIFSKEQCNQCKVQEFTNKIFSLNYFWKSDYLTQRYSNFMDMVLRYKPNLIEEYVENINEIDSSIEEDNVSILYSSNVLPILKNSKDINAFIKKIRFPWRSYYSMSNYYLYYNNNINALNSIIKALKCCPYNLREDYKYKEKIIINTIINNKN